MNICYYLFNNNLHNLLDSGLDSDMSSTFGVINTNYTSPKFSDYPCQTSIDNNDITIENKKNINSNISTTNS